MKEEQCLDCKAEAGAPHAKFCGIDACHRFGLWCVRKRGHLVPCAKGTPGAVEDLATLALSYQWVKEKEEWVKR